MAEEAPDAVSYEMLQDLLRAERRSNKLMAVPARFWPMVREFLQVVGEAFRIEQAKDPFSRKVMMLSDQAKNAMHASQSLWSLRERKLAMLALAATKERRMPEGITPDEGALYTDLVNEFEATRGRIFEGTISAPSLVPPPLPVPTPALLPSVGPPQVQMPVIERAEAAPAVVAAPIQVPHDTKSAPQELTTIRALTDLPPFVGPDMQTYQLKAGDIATVPPSIANLLVRRSKAAIVDVPA